MIIFNKVKFRNFFSFGNNFTEIELNATPTTLVTAKNGAGKSSAILDSVYFALFGSAFRSINKKQIVNSINRGECEVELEFAVDGINYRIVRGINPNVFEIYKNDNLLDQVSSVKEYQENLEKNIIKMNEKAFRQIVVLGSASYVPFMKLTAAERREVIENLLGISIFSSMNVLMKEKNTKLKEQIAESERNTTLVSHKLQSALELLEKEKGHTEEKKEYFYKVIAENEAKIEVETNKKAHTEKQLTQTNLKLAELQTEDIAQLIKDTLNTEGKLEYGINDHKKQIDFFTNTKDTCPICKQSLSKEHTDKMIQEHNEIVCNHNKKLTEVKETIKKLNGRQEELQTLKNRIRELQTDIYTTERNITDSKVKIAECNRNITMISNNTNLADLQASYDKIKQEKEKQDKEYNNLLKLKRYYTIALDLLKDSGIKAMIVKEYVPTINNLMNKYLQKFNLPVGFTIDENFNETIKSRYCDVFTYDSFSEGQKARIDLGFLLTFRELARLKNTHNCNLLIMDEVFDGSLDAEATNELTDLLKRELTTNNVFVISHRSDGFVEKFDRLLEFEKNDNFSHLKA